MEKWVAELVTSLLKTFQTLHLTQNKTQTSKCGPQVRQVLWALLIPVTHLCIYLIKQVFTEYVSVLDIAKF